MVKLTERSVNMSVKCLEWPTHVNCEDLLILGIEIIFPSLKKILKVVLFRCEYVSVSTPLVFDDYPPILRVVVFSLFSVTASRKQRIEMHLAALFIIYDSDTSWKCPTSCPSKCVHCIIRVEWSTYFVTVRTREGLYSTSETTEFCLAPKTKTRILHAI